MCVVAPGYSPERLPRLDGYLTVGLRREIEDYLGGIDVALDAGSSIGRTAVIYPLVQVAETAHLVLGIPANALTAVP